MVALADKPRRKTRSSVTRRARREPLTVASIKGIMARIEESRGKIAAIEKSMLKDGIREITFDGTSGIERAFDELDGWTQLATLALLKARMDKGYELTLDD